MKMHRALFASAVLSLVAGGLALWGGVPARAADAGTTTLVPISGTVNGVPESVVFTGQAKINSRLARDPDFNSPKLVLIIDLRGLSAVGSSTRSKYVISGPELVQRRFAATQDVEIAFPFAKGDFTAISAAQTGVASFALDFDLTNGAITKGAGNVSSPNFPR
jgi:hypothetical protein